MSRVARLLIAVALAGGMAVLPRAAAGAPPAAVVLNFEDGDIQTVVQAVSEVLGFNFVLAPDVRGKVTVRTSSAIPREDVFAVFLSILEVHGFTAVRAGDLYKIVRSETARERAIPTIVVPLPAPPPAARMPEIWPGS